MTTLKARIARKFLVIKAAREFKKEIEKAGLDNLKILADKGISIVGTYLRGCSPQEKAGYRHDLNVLLQMGVSVDMILDEVARQMPELAPIMKDRASYRKSEIEEVWSFLKE